MARKWLGSLYNNTGWSYVNLGEYEAALELFQRALKVRENDGTPEQINVAKYCVAKVFRLLGQPTKSLVIQESLRNKDNLDGFTEEEIGECLLALGKPAQAKSFFRIAYDILSKIGWVADDEQRMARLREFVA
jgi:tetratricopeptide (TPR) repeat protein